MTATPSAFAAVVDPVEARGRAFVEGLHARKFAELVAGFDATMANALPADKLEATWDGLEAGVGKFGGVESARVERSGAYRVAIVTCKFEKTKLDAKIAFDKDDKIAGLFFAPPLEPYSDPPYVDRTKFSEREVTVGAGEWALPGTLSMPNGDGPFPAVVLVHGSGPNDRDESVGANKPFKDLAGGLASRGIAALRYDKRTKVHVAKLGDMSSFTAAHETIDDAVAAAELLAATKGIDPKRIVVAGHSLGGEFAPRIAASSDRVAAIAILAGSTRPLTDMMIEQMSYIASLDGRKAPEELDEIKKIEAAGKRIKEVQGGAEVKPGEILLGAGAAYWLDLAKHDARAIAKGLKKPIFVAQGGRDYQVTKVDFENWKKAIGERPGVVYKLYPELNHVFGAGEGKSSPEEYNKRAPVDPRLVGDLAAFVESVK